MTNTECSKKSTLICNAFDSLRYKCKMYLQFMTKSINTETTFEY